MAELILLVLIALIFIFMSIAEYKHNMETLEFEERIQRLRYKILEELGTNEDDEKYWGGARRTPRPCKLNFKATRTSYLETQTMCRQMESTCPKITWYQCTDLPNFYSKNGHQSYKDEGSFALEGILCNRENIGQFIEVYNYVERGGRLNGTGIFMIIEDGLLLPYKPSKELEPYQYQACILNALTDKGGECTRTQLLNQIQLTTDISPYNFVSALDTLKKQGKIIEWEEHGTMYITRM